MKGRKECVDAKVYRRRRPGDEESSEKMIELVTRCAALLLLINNNKRREGKSVWVGRAVADGSRLAIGGRLSHVTGAFSWSLE